MLVSWISEDAKRQGLDRLFRHAPTDLMTIIRVGGIKYFDKEPEHKLHYSKDNDGWLYQIVDKNELQPPSNTYQNGEWDVAKDYDGEYPAITFDGLPIGDKLSNDYQHYPSTPAVCLDEMGGSSEFYPEIYKEGTDLEKLYWGEMKEGKCEAWKWKQFQFVKGKYKDAIAEAGDSNDDVIAIHHKEIKSYCKSNNLDYDRITKRLYYTHTGKYQGSWIAIPIKNMRDATVRMDLITPFSSYEIKWSKKPTQKKLDRFISVMEDSGVESFEQIFCGFIQGNKISWKDNNPFW